MTKISTGTPSPTPGGGRLQAFMATVARAQELERQRRRIERQRKAAEAGTKLMQEVIVPAISRLWTQYRSRPH